jgi:hypothetical protein
MARTVRDTNLEARTARLRLTPRPKPYWRVLESGLHLGYRRTQEGVHAHIGCVDHLDGRIMSGSKCTNASSKRPIASHA